MYVRTYYVAFNGSTVTITTCRFLYIDTDECSLDEDVCGQICTNTDGGFFCSCENGYLLENDSRTCEG